MCMIYIYIWLLVKTRVPSYPKMAAYWVVIPQKCMVIIGFDPSPCINIDHCIYNYIYIYVYIYIHSIYLDKYRTNPASLAVSFRLP